MTFVSSFLHKALVPRSKKSARVSLVWQLHVFITLSSILFDLYLLWLQYVTLSLLNVFLCYWLHCLDLLWRLCIPERIVWARHWRFPHDHKDLARFHAPNPKRVAQGAQGLIFMQRKDVLLTCWQDRKPLRIHLEAASFLQRNSRHVERFVHFLVDCCIEYFTRTTTYHHDEQRHYYTRSSSSSASSDKEKHSSKTSSTADKKKTKKDEDEQKEKTNNNSNNNMMAKSAVAASALGFSLYSTYQASAAMGHVNFQNQLERLLDHVSAALKSTSIWIKEREKLEDPVHDMIRQDVIRIRQLVHHVERLDSRSLRKKEAAGW